MPYQLSDLVGWWYYYLYVFNKIKHSQIENNVDLDYIFIDDVSMLGEVFYKFLMTIENIRPDIKFIISGDYNQLKPVNDRISKDTDYSKANSLVCLSLQIIIN